MSSRGAAYCYPGSAAYFKKKIQGPTFSFRKLQIKFFVKLSTLSDSRAQSPWTSRCHLKDMTRRILNGKLAGLDPARVLFYTCLG